MTKKEFMKRVAKLSSPYVSNIRVDEHTLQHYLRDGDYNAYLRLLETNYKETQFTKTAEKYRKWLDEERNRRELEKDAKQTIEIVVTDLSFIKKQYGKSLFEEALDRLGYDKKIDTSPLESGIEDNFTKGGE